MWFYLILVTYKISIAYHYLDKIITTEIQDSLLHVLRLSRRNNIAKIKYALFINANISSILFHDFTAQ